MKKTTLLLKVSLLFFISFISTSADAQDFQGKAYYFSKTSMDMSRFSRGRELSEQDKKRIAERMKSLLEKTYILTFNKEESIYKEDEKLSLSVGNQRGGGFFGSNFSAGPQYKNVKEQLYLQDQEFFGKQFLIKEPLNTIEWTMGSETKQIGQYTCFKATARKPSTEIEFPTRGGRERNETAKDSSKVKADTGDINEVKMVDVVAWYTPQIPVSQGPSEYWGLPGLILEVSAGNITMLCSKIILNPEEKTEIKVPAKGKEVTKQEYNEIVTKKMQEFRDSRGRGNGRPGGGGGRR